MDDRHVLRAVASAQTSKTLMKDHVEDPMLAGLHTPMGAHQPAFDTDSRRVGKPGWADFDRRAYRASVWY